MKLLIPLIALFVSSTVISGCGGGGGGGGDSTTSAPQGVTTPSQVNVVTAN